MDGLLVVNWLLALLVCGVEIRNLWRDRRHDRWVRGVTLAACVYVWAYYSYVLLFGQMLSGMQFARPGTTLLVTAILARAVYDIYRVPGRKV